LHFLENIMLFHERTTGHIVEVLSLGDLVDLFKDEVIGRYQYGEEVQDPEKFRKSDLVFLSGEELPRCWTDPHYRDDELSR
jgi:hypothetical protein